MGVWRALFQHAPATALEMTGAAPYFAAYAAVARAFRRRNAEAAADAAADAAGSVGRGGGAAAVFTDTDVRRVDSSIISVDVDVNGDNGNDNGVQRSEGDSLLPWQAFVSGSAAGAAFLLSYPFDVAKARLMAQAQPAAEAAMTKAAAAALSSTMSAAKVKALVAAADRSRRPYSGVIDCMRRIVREEGALALTR
jgi:hypothetical protein